MPVLDREAADLERVRQLEKCQRDSWYLAGKLGYWWNPAAGGGEFPGKGLTEEFHRPIMRWMDAFDDEAFLGVWFARWHHKTTIMVIKMIQCFLRDPWTSMLYFHAVLERTQEVVSEVGNHLLKNQFLRSLEPIGFNEHGDKYCVKALPHPQKARWLKAQSFTVDRPHAFYSRFPTLAGQSAGSEATGAHAKIGFLDDVIGEKDITDSTVMKKTDWFGATVLNVIDDMWLRASGTPWCDYGLYVDWWESDDWKTLVIPGSTPEAYVDDVLDLQNAVKDWTQSKIHLNPRLDEKKRYDLSYPVYGEPKNRKGMSKKLKILQRQMKGHFPYQIMVDTSPRGEKPWDKEECEHFVGWEPTDTKPGASGPGFVVVLSDPAPMGTGSPDTEKQRLRADASKDFWSISVHKLRLVGETFQNILLDGSHSQRWSESEGWNEVCRLMKKWNTSFAIHEAYGSLITAYDTQMADAANRNHVRWRRYDRDRKPLRFKESYQAKAKNLRISALATLAREEEFFVYEKVPQDFLYGPLDGSVKHAGFLTQMRAFKAIPESARNNLKYDDDADIVARSQDSVMSQFIPIVEEDKLPEFNPFHRYGQPTHERRSRYII